MNEFAPSCRQTPRWVKLALLAAILLLVILGSGCAMHSPGAKVSNTVNVSVMPPAVAGL